MMRKNFVYQFVVWLGILFVLFPFIGFGILQLDLQPYAFVFVGLFFLTKVKKIPIKFVPYLLYAILCTLIVIATGDEFNMAVRAIIIGWSPFLFAFFSYSLLKKKWDLQPFFVFGIFILLVCAVLQLFVSRDLFESVVTCRYTQDRGVTSLTPEPSMYGMYLILMYCAFLISGHKTKKYNFAVAFTVAVQVFLFSMSALSMGIFSVASTVFFWFSKNKRTATLLAVVFFVVAVYFIFDFFGSDVRALNLIRGLYKSPSELIKLDQSIKDRLLHLLLPLKGFVDNLGFPRGIGAFEQYASRHAGIHFFSKDNSKIMSGIGAILFENGIIGFVLLSFIVKTFVRAHIHPNIKAFVATSLLLSTIGSAGFGLPIIGVIIGILEFNSKQEVVMRVGKNENQSCY